ncbi:MAG: hypothetical protein ACOCY6_04480 [Halodesulfurarchaeum sp.]
MAGAGNLTTVGSAAAETDGGYDLQIPAGSGLEFAETALGETVLQAPLSDGSTYYLYQHRPSPFEVDTVDLVLAADGTVSYLESLEGVEYTQSEIGVMADRIGEMADRIVYTEELIVETGALTVDVIVYTQHSTLEFVELLNPLSIL